MKNGEVCEHVKSLDNYSNNSENEYISEKLVKDGYGQSCGGYLIGYSNNDLKKPSQKDHFLS